MNNKREKYIFHIDVNSAFLSWSAVKRLEEDPQAIDLRTIPSAVGGDVEKRHGVITAKSIPAKAFGVKTGEPVVKALQKCPQLVLVRSDFQTYRKYSHAFIEILRRYTDQIQQVSIDEAYLDVTDLIRTEAARIPNTGEKVSGEMHIPDGQKALPTKSMQNLQMNREFKFARDNPEAEKCRIGSTHSAIQTTEDQIAGKLADSIRNEIRDSLGFTVNVGISVNKILAKTASDFRKPDLVHTLFPEEIEEKFWPMPIGDLHGCGPASARKLEQMGIRTIGAAASADIAVLEAALGKKAGLYIQNSANGHGSAEVHTEDREAKGYSNETTTRSDIGYENYSDTEPIIDRLAESVSRRLSRDGVYAHTISVMVKTNDFRRHSRQLTVPDATNRYEVIRKNAEELLRQMSFGENGLITQGYQYRLIGIRAANLDSGEYRQVNLFDYLEEHKETEKDRKLSEMMKKIRDRYGDDAVHHGT